MINFQEPDVYVYDVGTYKVLTVFEGPRGLDSKYVQFTMFYHDKIINSIIYSSFDIGHT